MMHIPAFSLDGIFGLSPVLYGANVFGTTVETDKASAETFQSAMRSSGLVTMDFMMSPEQREQVRKHVASVSKTGGVMVLEKGSDFKKLSFDPVSAQLLESRSFNVEEICRWFGLDPAMVGHGGKDSNWGTGLEQKMLWFLIFALRQWCVRIEQAIRKNLLTPVERMTYFAEFNMEGLLRGDSTSRAAFYASAAQNGWKSRNEIRRLENDPPVAGGDDLTVQSNLVPIALLGKQPQATAPQPAAAMQIQLTSFDASLKSVAESVLAMQKGQQQIAEVLDVFAKTQDGLQQSTALVADATKRSAEKLERATDEITSAVNQMAKPRRAVFDEDGDLKGSEVVDSLD